MKINAIKGAHSIEQNDTNRARSSTQGSLRGKEVGSQWIWWVKGALLGKSKEEIYGCHDKAILHHARVCPNMFRETAYKKGREAGRDMHSILGVLRCTHHRHWSATHYGSLLGIHTSARTAILHLGPWVLCMLLGFRQTTRSTTILHLIYSTGNWSVGFQYTHREDTLG